MVAKYNYQNNVNFALFVNDSDMTHANKGARGVASTILKLRGPCVPKSFDEVICRVGVFYKLTQIYAIPVIIFYSVRGYVTGHSSLFHKVSSHIGAVYAAARSLK
jgi:hypothetical protein